MNSRFRGSASGIRAQPPSRVDRLFPPCTAKLQAEESTRVSDEPRGSTGPEAGFQVLTVEVDVPAVQGRAVVSGDAALV